MPFELPPLPYAQDALAPQHRHGALLVRQPEGVLDPPSLAKKESERAGAIQAYGRLARQGIDRAIGITSADTAAATSNTTIMNSLNWPASMAAMLHPLVSGRLVGPCSACSACIWACWHGGR
jgi:hypothetical protein